MAKSRDLRVRSFHFTVGIVIAAAYPAVAPRLQENLQESNELIAMITASVLTAKSNPHRGSPPQSLGTDDAEG
jgi:hypothetical protein